DPQLGLPIAVDVNAEAGVAPAAAAIEPRQAFTQRFRGRVLHLRHHRGADPQATGVDAVRAVIGLFAEPLDEVAADLLHEIAALVAELGAAAGADGVVRPRAGRA